MLDPDKPSVGTNRYRDSLNDPVNKSDKNGQTASDNDGGNKQYAGSRSEATDPANHQSSREGIANTPAPDAEYNARADYGSGYQQKFGLYGLSICMASQKQISRVYSRLHEYASAALKYNCHIKEDIWLMGPSNLTLKEAMEV